MNKTKKKILLKEVLDIYLEEDYDLVIPFPDFISRFFNEYEIIEEEKIPTTDGEKLDAKFGL